MYEQKTPGYISVISAAAETKEKSPPPGENGLNPPTTRGLENET
jgi:hypothetical protein